MPTNAEDYISTHTGEEIDNAVDAVATKSTVAVSATGTATDEVSYITVDGVEKKIAGGGGRIADNLVVDAQGRLCIQLEE